MTAEIAILNKQAVALAADSAVSTSNKIFRSANKIFSLSKVAPVAIMVYSHADFCGIPWETIIKEYRKYNGLKKHDTLNEYVCNFFNFIKNNDIIKSHINDEKMLIQLVMDYFINNFENDIANIAELEFKASGTVSSDSINERIRYIFTANMNNINMFPDLDLVSSVSYDVFKSNFLDIITEKYEKSLKHFETIIPNLFDKFTHIIYELLTKNIFPMGYSGVVFAGFGEKELYPSVETYHLGSFVNGHLQLIKIEGRCRRVSNTNFATVIPFAQDDIITMFVRGIHPEIQNKIFEIFKSVINEQNKSLLDIVDATEAKRIEVNDTINNFTKRIQDKLNSNINDFIYENFIDPTLDIISILPPNELANFAESLINLTSIKRQISLDRETVGGPTDVALISKGDGLIWIKRKHYFDPALNHHFFKNYFNGGGQHEQEREEHS